MGPAAVQHALTKLLRDTGLAEKYVPHGFRSSFRDWCAETGKPREVAEAALAHVVGGVEALTSGQTCSSGAAGS